MKNYDKNIESSYIEYLDANNLYGWAMSQKLPVNDFKWVKQEELSKFNEGFRKNYDKYSNKGYFLEVDIDFPKELLTLQKDLPFLPESKKVNKVEKLICDKEELNEITSGNPKHKSNNQLYITKNVKNLYDSRQKIIDLLNDNSKIRSEAIYKSKQNETEGKELKILTPKQMLQRLAIAFAQVEAGNNSESLLKEIRQIVYSLYQ